MKGPLFSKHMLKPDPHNYIISRRPNQIVSYRVSALRQKSAQHFNSLDQKWKPESRIKPHQAASSMCPPFILNGKILHAVLQQIIRLLHLSLTDRQSSASDGGNHVKRQFGTRGTSFFGWKNPSGLQKPSESNPQKSNHLESITNGNPDASQIRSRTSYSRL